MSSEAILKLGAWVRPATMPDSLAVIVSSWETVHRGAGAESFYDRADRLEEGCQRVAAHWPAPLFNTDRPLGGSWALARLEGGQWRVLVDEPASDRAVADTIIVARAKRLLATRRWAQGDQELLRTLLAAPVSNREALLADEGAARSLRSLATLRLVEQAESDDAELPASVRQALERGAVVWLTEESRSTAAVILQELDRRKLVAARRTQRTEEKRERGEDLKQVLTAAVRNIFPAIPEEVAMAAAVRLTPAMIKLGRRPEMQGIVDAVAEIRLERWRQAVAAEPHVAKRLEIMQARGEPGRARKRYRDQRAAERVEAELEEWRGELRPVTTRRLGR